MKRLVSAYLIVVIVMVSGCASIVSGSKQQLTFNSEPSDASVLINGVEVGKTPMSVLVNRESDQTVSFEKEGFKTQTLGLSTTLNGWFWGNVVFGGFLGSTTDAASGAMHEYAPNQYYVTLVPVAAVPSSIDPVSEKAKVKDFIVLNYQRIMEDVSTGGGQYLSSLYIMLNVPKDSATDARKKLEALSTVYTIIPEFAEQVVDYFLKNQTGPKA